MDVILDLDLDFFLWPILHDRTEQDGRPSVREFEHCAEEDEVRRFLEKCCHLRKDARIPGRQFVEHEEAFRVWRRWLGERKLKSPFRVVHVDAHADLGAGWPNDTLVYLESVLKLQASRRCDPAFGDRCVNSSNYLTFAIACRWLESLAYVFPEKPPQVRVRDSNQLELLRHWLNDGMPNDSPPVGDLPPWCFQAQGCNWWKNPIQLSKTEPPVRFELVSKTEFEFCGFTHVTVAQSPYYTPEPADSLLPAIAEYFDLA